MDIFKEASGVGSLTGGIAGLYAWATTPALTGLQGIFGAAMIGAGTSFVAGWSCVGLALALNLVAGRNGTLLAYGMGIAAGLLVGFSEGKDIVMRGIESKAEETIEEQEDASAAGITEQNFTYEAVDAAAPKVTIMQPV